MAITVSEHLIDYVQHGRRTRKSSKRLYWNGNQVATMAYDGPSGWWLTYVKPRERKLYKRQIESLSNALIYIDEVWEEI